MPEISQDQLDAKLNKDEAIEKELNEISRKLFLGDCEFVLGVADLKQLPMADLPEVAFVGRSNVGKSSLINALVQRKLMARVSNTPGRTQQLNFFNLGGHFHMVDMPGYGYAKVSKEDRKSWDSLIKDYLRGRETLRSVFILIDGRHGLKDSDREMMKMLDESAVSYRLVLTKCDKGKRLNDMCESILKELESHAAGFNEIYRTSSLKNTGIDEMRRMIYDVTHV